MKIGNFSRLFLLFAAMYSSAQADSFSADDLNWLKKMTAASRHTEYSGTFIYQSGSYIETSRITHVRDGENEYERLEGLDGERSEVIRKNDQIWCFLGDGKEMVAKRNGARTFPALLPEQLDLLQENYRISHGVEGRVAGYSTRTILFHPRDKMRYSHQMWSYTGNGMLLKAVVLDEQNHVMDQYAFTQLQIGGEIDRRWVKQDNSAGAKNNQTVQNDAAHTAQPEPVVSGWEAYALPRGFKKVAELSRSMKGSETPVIQLAYSDGLAGISVFIEKLGQRNGIKQGLFSKGVTHVFTKTLDGNLLTVVGEVPPRTVMQVAESVRFEGQNK